MRHEVRIARIATFAMAATLLAGCYTYADVSGDEDILLDQHPLTPVMGDNTQIANGIATGESLEQPIKFPHWSHAAKLEIECEYCHSEARKSLHAGVPPTQTCMGCHKWVRQEAPEIKKVAAYYDSGDPIPWKKVHDLPDYVYFTHKRHVRAGVQCTECHGQIKLQGKPANVDPGEGEWIADSVDKVMVRETSLQMGWCLDCHGTHPKIDENYGELADLRRAELKDCWTCHK